VQWRKRVASWEAKLAKTNKKGKAYKRVARRQKAATAYQAYRKLYHAWYYAMYYTYRSKVGDDKYKKYQPQASHAPTSSPVAWFPIGKCARAPTHVLKSTRPPHSPFLPQN